MAIDRYKGKLHLLPWKERRALEEAEIVEKDVEKVSEAVLRQINRSLNEEV